MTKLKLSICGNDENPMIIDIDETTMIFFNNTKIQSDDALDLWMLKNVWSGQHLSGTCKMGPKDDGMAVVNQRGSVHGIQGLRVADASIMPDCIRSNYNLTILMIVESIADWMVNS